MANHNPGCSQPVGYQQNGAPTNDFRNPGNSQLSQTLHTADNDEWMSSTQSRRSQTLSAENMVLGTSSTPTMASGTLAAPRIQSQHVTSNTLNGVQIPSTQRMPYMVTRTPPSTPKVASGTPIVLNIPSETPHMNPQTPIHPMGNRNAGYSQQLAEPQGLRREDHNAGYSQQRAEPRSLLREDPISHEILMRKLNLQIPIQWPITMLGILNQWAITMLGILNQWAITMLGILNQWAITILGILN